MEKSFFLQPKTLVVILKTNVEPFYMPTKGTRARNNCNHLYYCKGYTSTGHSSGSKENRLNNGKENIVPTNVRFEIISGVANRSRRSLVHTLGYTTLTRSVYNTPNIAEVRN